MRSAQVTISDSFVKYKIKNKKERIDDMLWKGNFLFLFCASIQSEINRQELPPCLTLASVCLHQSTNQQWNAYPSALIDSMSY